ncbi:MAG: 4-hydroxythreonine-4-phosphate dehydrogenase PdxA [Bacteroidetes bacterium]|nr:4-hydroxythreonine-4-phosphate dehydrogenase PdxA [Bacteroidota bacterium]
MSNPNREKIRVGITIGDAAGVGPEIIMKTFSDDRLFKQFTPIVFGNPRVFSFYKKALNIEKFQYASIKDYKNLSHNSINIVPVWEDEFAISPGQPSSETGKFAFLSLKAACEALKNGDIDVLVTAPINKNVIQSAEFNNTGHTEYLQKFFGAKDNLMFLVADDIKVGLVTNHEPISEVAKNITKEKIQRKIQLINKSLQEDFGIDKPKVAVLGLNPHAGDKGLVGQEELDIIFPAVKEMRDQQNIIAFGPYPADGFFASDNWTKFDAILAMYHDQGLIPFKYIAGAEGVNFTAGLSVVRTSPDHGTAENIAGKGVADETSFRNAIYKAVDIFNNRLNYAEMRSNPLKKLAKFEEER